MNALFAECEGAATDLIFVVDASGSICDDENVTTCENWQTIRLFVGGLVDELVIGPEDTRVGVVVYGNLAYLRIGLTQYDNQQDLKDAVSKLVYDPKKGTNTSGGIQVMREEFANNHREGATQISIIITDGKATRDIDSTIPNAEAARADGIIIFAIGITDSINEDELQSLSSEPQVLGENFFVSPTFDALSNIEDVVTTEVCEAADPVLGL